jgi:hypothetical protein
VDRYGEVGQPGGANYEVILNEANAMPSAMERWKASVAPECCKDTVGLNGWAFTTPRFRRNGCATRTRQVRLCRRQLD